MLWVASIFIVTALIVPNFLLPLNRIWAVFAFKLGIFNNYFVLGLFFFLIVLPTGLIARICGYDPLKLKTLDLEECYWSKVDRLSNEETLKDLF